MKQFANLKKRLAKLMKQFGHRSLEKMTFELLNDQTSR